VRSAVLFARGQPDATPPSLIEVHQQHALRPETLYLAINIVDRYVSKRIVFKKHFQVRPYALRSRQS
jgi:hypothetical protein